MATDGTRRTEILIETHEISIIRFGRKQSEIDLLQKSRRPTGRLKMRTKRILAIAAVLGALMLIGYALLRSTHGG